MMNSTPIRNRAAAAAAFSAAVVLWSGAAMPASAGQGDQDRAAGARQRGVVQISATEGGDGATLAARNLPLGLPVLRIYRSVNADGSVAFSDRAQPGAREVQIRTFASASDPQAVATALRQQQHWQDRAQAFEERLEQRDWAERFEQAARQRPFPSPEYLVTR